MNKYAKFFSLLKQINANGLSYTKEEVVKDFTDGKTESLSGLSAWQLQELERKMMQMTAPVPLNNQNHFETTDPVRDRMRKAIISQFKSIGRNAQQAIAWAEKYGVNGVKKPFNDYTTEELIILIRNAEHVKEDFIESFDKNTKVIPLNKQ